MNTPGLAEKQHLVHCHGSSPDGTDQGQTGPESKKGICFGSSIKRKIFLLPEGLFWEG